MMIRLNELHDIEFHIENIFILKDSWTGITEYDYLEKGRSRNLIHIITSGTRYYLANGNSFTLKAGDLLLIPDKTRYYTRSVGECSGIGICFDIVSDGKYVELVRDVYHGWNDRYGGHLAIINEMIAGSIAHTSLHRTALMWKLLDKMISREDELAELSQLIMPAVNFIREHYRENLSVADYAAACHLSESHFRRKFHEFTSMAPLEYRDSLRFEAAERMFSDGMTMTRIAEELGFCDASYLRRIYKRRTGRNFRDCKVPGII